MTLESQKDDPTISDDFTLWRRIHPDWIVPDNNAGSLRVSSAAFADSPDGTPMSVLLSEVVRATGRGERDVLLGFDGYALASITAGQARQCQQGIARSPLPTEPAHAHVCGLKSKPLKRCMARCAVWAIPPPSPQS
jgi:hypothetical protein